MTNEPTRSRRHLTNLARAVRFSIKAISIILPILYAWLSFRNLSFQEIVAVLSNATALDVFWKVVLLIYYTGWVFGASMDTNFHEDVSFGAPYDGRLPLQAIGLLVLFLVVAILLLYSNTYEQFVLFITVFFITNLVGYAYISAKFTKPMLEESRIEYERNNELYSLERLAIFEHYMLGWWQIWRFAAGALIIAIMIGIALIKYIYGQIQYLESVPIELLQASGMLLFVGVMEVWIFSMRIRTRAGLAALDQLASKYELQRIAAKTPA